MTTHQEHLQRLERFCVVLARTMLECDPPDQSNELFRTTISAECAECGVEVSGDELMALSRAALDGEHAKLKRLRLGDCARKGCNSYYYRLSFAPCSSLDWPILLSRIKAELQRPGASPEVPEAAPTSKPRLWFPSFSYRVWIALCLIFLLLVARQWHRGGRIPFVREPEDFRVDPAPADGGVRDSR